VNAQEGGHDASGDFTASLVFGPLPTSATRIKVAANVTVATRSRTS